MELNNMYKIISLTGCLFLLSACQITQRNSAENQKEVLNAAIQSDVEQLIIPADIEAELYADLENDVDVIEQEDKRINISARDVDARVFFASLINDSTFSVAIDPDVSGTITLELKQVTLPEALAVIEDIYGYEIKLQGRVYHIYPAGMRVASFTLDYLFMNRVGGSRTTVLSGSLTNNDSDSDSDSDDDSSSSSSSSSSGSSPAAEMKQEFAGKYENSGLEDGTEITTITSTNYWAYLDLKLKTLLRKYGQRDIIISPMSGVVTVRGYPKEIREVREFLEKETENLNRQVILETQIIEVTLSNEYQQGVSWSSIPAALGDTSNIAFSTTHKLADSLIQSTIGGGAAITFSNSDFSSVVSLLETQGDVNVLSKPRITAMNNQKAVIKVGSDEYFVTDVSTTTVSGIDSATPNVELTPFFSGISLDVTPKISDDGTVLLHVHPAIIDVEEQLKTISFGSESTANLVLPLAKSNVRESDTIVKAKSGDVIVIGGLMKTMEKDVVSKVPFLGDVPWLGELFTNRQKVQYKTELIILVKPEIVKKNTWTQEISKSSELIEKWYPSK